MVLYVLCNPVHFVFWLMDFYLRICCRNSINLTIRLFFFKYRPLPHIDSEFRFGACLMRRKHFFSELIFFNHEFEVDIHIFARGHIVSFFLLLFLFSLLHFDSSLFPFLLNLFDGFHGWVGNLNKKKFICMYFRNLFSVCFQKWAL